MNEYLVELTFALIGGGAIGWFFTYLVNLGKARAKDNQQSKDIESLRQSQIELEHQNKMLQKDVENRVAQINERMEQIREKLQKTELMTTGRLIKMETQITSIQESLVILIKDVKTIGQKISV